MPGWAERILRPVHFPSHLPAQRLTRAQAALSTDSHLRIYTSLDPSLNDWTTAHDISVPALPSPISNEEGPNGATGNYLDGRVGSGEYGENTPPPFLPTPAQTPTPIRRIPYVPSILISRQVESQGNTTDHQAGPDAYCHSPHIRTVPSRDPVANRWYDRPHDGAHARVVRGAAVEEGVRTGEGGEAGRMDSRGRRRVWKRRRQSRHGRRERSFDGQHSHKFQLGPKTMNTICSRL
jgi:hypothetical protein